MYDSLQLIGLSYTHTQNYESFFGGRGGGMRL